ncbi:Transcriptional regulatory protein ZraR [Rosistilla ulvae]|uniref:Transcriptional regulatory protein ZraR n=1 Tax=Rosistilla ulvae TaxID=1930277 RepID=A0A517LWG6_9BACT|nr:sigma-54 dependent transcriptional regulator [Rosistilla ulvae]QDS86971.1 Transcriptional regulatory protein ZraR [Rosistilla ulvae]
MTLNPKLLLVDDDRRLAESMADWLRYQQFSVDQAHSLATGRRAIQEHSYDLLLLDLRLEDGDGFELIAETKRRQPDCAILVLTGYATPSTAIEAVKAGAFDLLTKPLVDEELSHALERALAQRNIEAENEQLRAQLDSRFGLEHILSHDYRMLKIFDVIDSVADARASVLITGENGTGKSMIARAVHKRSNRRSNPFVEVACGALPDNLLESELFGHVIGAFTGATTNKIGKFKQADGGTIFLDEIGTASQAFQVKLLRVLQELQFEPLGGTETDTVDTRVILATNENLSHAVTSGQFRQDLFYRVNVINIELPALRERAGDVPLLVDHFLREVCEATGRDVQGFDRDALATLQAYSWPGNVRELENVVERAVLLARDSVLTRHDLPPQLLASSGQPQSVIGSVASSGMQSNDPDQPQTLREALEEPERRIILESLRSHNWNRAATADTLGVNRTTLYKKMKRLGLDDPRLQFMGAEAH